MSRDNDDITENQHQNQHHQQDQYPATQTLPYLCQGWDCLGLCICFSYLNTLRSLELSLVGIFSDLLNCYSNQVNGA